MMPELIGYFFAGMATAIMLALMMLIVVAIRAAGVFIKITVYGIILVSILTALGYSTVNLIGGF